MDIDDKLKALSTEKLIDVVKNYELYGYSNEIRSKAIAILNSERQITLKDLVLTGNLENHSLDIAKNCFKVFKKTSFYTLALYILSIVAIPFLNRDLEGTMPLIFSAIIWTVYLGLLLKSYFAYRDFYQSLNIIDNAEPFAIFGGSGFIFYFLAHFYFLDKMKKVLREFMKG